MEGKLRRPCLSLAFAKSERPYAYLRLSVEVGQRAILLDLSLEHMADDMRRKAMHLLCDGLRLAGRLVRPQAHSIDDHKLHSMSESLANITTEGSLQIHL